MRRNLRLRWHQDCFSTGVTCTRKPVCLDAQVSINREILDIDDDFLIRYRVWLRGWVQDQPHPLQHNIQVRGGHPGLQGAGGQPGTGARADNRGRGGGDNRRGGGDHRGHWKYCGRGNYRGAVIEVQILILCNSEGSFNWNSLFWTFKDW